ncbi:hypothetical protein A3J90_02665 [candidate division WOR-1 bacterium RIFOXYC2_FULL_37_10]|uniref:Uncharacterized protein n=1 Tax=candidate division WOR-1 bacterium RIFOXYB2_FULL_37_13 TaxID=1802579 RepID=A0A1F4SHV6_UNCSA|nr:MAG: hypothetical protein A2246_02900 [candidate division WOR-1 bacterium RIFOXYA2_FULL_37_7]OGC19967.1 MAG: hypothetical protein A2310_01235 [candidate division WOR-1 bacterium RIFOXYB2_FULL_37_13]OGC36614.1 MAG: hypothetical protein A3J90_02665 [candidate division WOR-1 bacterium RIFOXYC2_FULL_37_10]
MKKKKIFKKILFALIMTATSPLWLLLCMLYGIIIGPVGYAVFFFQNLHENFIVQQFKYEDYLKRKETGNIDPLEPSLSSPSSFAVTSFLFSPVIIVISLILGIMFGWIKAIDIFYKRTYRKFFAIDWEAV